MKRILIQLDTNSQFSSFDSVVAIDAGIDELLSYGGVTPDNVEALVHGAIFTRRQDDLKNTAIFIGGSNVAAGEKLLQRVSNTFFGPIRVSVMMDTNGSNTTAVAAVLAARKELTLSGTETLVLGGTGPVGFRVSQLFSIEGAKVRVGSRSLERAQQTCDAIASIVESADVTPFQTAGKAELEEACQGVELIVAAGAAGVEILPAEQREQIDMLKVAVDLNAVPPVGLTGIDATDNAVERNGVICYGGISIGGRKMKIHKAALEKLFQTNNCMLDTTTIYELGQTIS